MLLSLLLTLAQAQAVDERKLYPFGPDSQRQEGVPKGEVIKQKPWASKIFEGTVRDWWIYVPPGYDKAKAHPVMVFQDGGGYVNESGAYRVPVVLDNLIHKKELPPIVGIFINPGHKSDELPRDPWKPNNRSFEYDTLSDQYARFLIEEMLPEAAKQTGLKLTDDPERRAIGGISSGGICAWTVAWERPDAFRKVVSHCGSFTNLRGGNQYPSLIRRSAARPLRVFLQTGTQDLDVVFGNWVIANQDMAAALAYRGYDYQLVVGEGGHSLAHGGAIFPDTMRWLWRDYPRP
jgi:enterochelin esterase-like enzyme